MTNTLPPSCWYAPPSHDHALADLEAAQARAAALVEDAEGELRDLHERLTWLSTTADALRDEIGRIAFLNERLEETKESLVTTAKQQLRRLDCLFRDLKLDDDASAAIESQQESSPRVGLTRSRRQLKEIEHEEKQSLLDEETRRQEHFQELLHQIRPCPTGYHWYQSGSGRWRCGAVDEDDFSVTRVEV